MFALQCGICFLCWLGLGFLIATRTVRSFERSSRNMRVFIASVAFLGSAVVLLSGFAVAVGMSAIKDGKLTWPGFGMLLVVGTAFVGMQAFAMKLLAPPRIPKPTVTDTTSQSLSNRLPKS